MKVKITKSCKCASWSGPFDGPEVEVKEGQVFEVEPEDAYDDEHYSHIGKKGKPNLIIPKENCVVL